VYVEYNIVARSSYPCCGGNELKHSAHEPSMKLDLVTNVRVGSGTSICEIRVCVPDCRLEGNFTLSVSSTP